MTTHPASTLALSAMLLIVATASSARGEFLAAYAYPELDQKVEAILEKMTLEEKLGQLTQQWGGESQDVNPGAQKRALDDLLGLARSGKIGSFLGAHTAEYTNKLQKAAVEESRLGIPLILGNDVIHGYRTITPIPLAEAASWDLGLIEDSAHMAAIEARAAGTHWTFAPMVDICRDPRWGRVAEGAGEDPFLGSLVAAARVRGFQGDDLTAPDRMLACAKHYVAYGAAEGGRDYNTVDMSLQTLHEIFLPPFRAAVDAGCGTLMSAFNDVNGVPASGNPYTLRTILRDEWGFGGFVVSDWTSVTEMIAHGFAKNPADAAIKSLTAGVDMDMCSFSYRGELPRALELGLITPDVIDDAVRNVLRAKLLLGLFDNPYSDAELEKKVTLAAENRRLARRLAAGACVLLRNEKQTLPLKDNPGKIAIIGPLADNTKDLLGTWAGIGKPEDVITLKAGVTQRAKGAKITCLPGCSVRGDAKDDDASIEAAIKAAKDADVVILALGESEDMSGEAHSRSRLDLPGRQRELAQRIKATGKPIIAVLFAGRPLSTPWLAENADALLMAWHGGVEAGNGVADVLFGDVNPSGRMPITTPRSVGQVPLYYYHKNTGRPPRAEERYTSKYIDTPWTPLYPFGHGLTYTTFAYRNLRVEPAEIGPAGEVTVTAEIENTGSRAGAEVVQLYVRDVVGSCTRPVRQLRGFDKIQLNAGEKTTVRFTLTPADLGFYNPELDFIVEPGEFKVWVAPDAASGLEGSFKVVEREI